MSTHTPGPWIVRHLTGFPLMIATQPDADGFGEPIADTSRHMLPAEALANARLIAAAPDLLAACKRMSEALKNAPHATQNAYQGIWTDIDNAIAKAEGAA